MIPDIRHLLLLFLLTLQVGFEISAVASALVSPCFHAQPREHGVSKVDDVRRAQLENECVREADRARDRIEACRFTGVSFA